MSKRRAYVCPKCDPPKRVFLLAGQNGGPPKCSKHGTMEVQANEPYRKGRG